MEKTPEEIKDWAEDKDRQAGDELVIAEKQPEDAKAMKITKKVVRKL